MFKTGRPLSGRTASVVFFIGAFVICALLLGVVIAPASYIQIASRITSFRSQEATQVVLAKKLAVLQNTGADVLDKSTESTIALPDKNPILGIMSQVKVLVAQEGVRITGVKSSGVSDFGDNIQKLELTISMESQSYDAITKVASELSSRAPLSTVDSLEISDSTNVKEGELTLVVYWSKLPENLPPLTQPLAAFSPDELTTLSKLSQLSAPQFSNLTPEAPTERENPFD